jgi:hypothetical protein
VTGDQHSGFRKNIPGGILHGKNLSRQFRKFRQLISVIGVIGGTFFFYAFARSSA